jgi:hypothetical protein
MPLEQSVDSKIKGVPAYIVSSRKIVDKSDFNIILTADTHSDNHLKSVKIGVEKLRDKNGIKLHPHFQLDTL